MARPTLFTNRKYLRLISILQIPEPHVLGLLEYMWRSVYESGQDILGDSIDVELAAKWNGESGVLTQALTDVGFIDENDGNFIVHDLYDHAPAYVQKRMEREIERIQRGTTISELRKEAGRKGGLATQDKVRQSKSKASGNQLVDLLKQTEANGSTPTPSPSPTPSPTQKRTLSSKTEFLKFWKLYPKKVKKLNAWNEWNKLRLDSCIDKILKAIKAQVENKAECRRLDIFSAAFPDPERWIKREQWDDELTPIIQPQQSLHPLQDVKGLLTPEQQAEAESDD
ncbi:hypothetical protein LCGC14_1969510 [marine sediment metagenome]|uniref:Phage replisome organiser N-terminal domain-containing protein n=1 Tax=marine sediment metagenome TaxID=412755 RepID=A0A0F9I951_9ZZZZ